MFDEYELLKKADKLTDEGKGLEALGVLKELRENASADFWVREGARVAELFGAAFSILGNADKAVDAYIDAVHYDKFLRSQLGHLSTYLFLLHYLQNVETKELYQDLSKYELLFGEIEQFKKAEFNHNKIRVGYLLHTLTKSSVSNFIAPFFDKFNKDEFEVYVYAFCDKDDDFAKEVKNAATVFRVLDNADLYEDAKTIRADEIDILADLSGHAEGGDTLSILAYRPANTQIVGIGWPSVTNLSIVDYIFADNFLIDDKMTDKPLNLKNALVFRPDKEMLLPYAQSKTDKNSVVFGVFNNFMKITDEMLSLWKEILHKLPTAKLHLQDSGIYEERVEYMRERLEKFGISNRATVTIANEDYLNDIANVDVILDTFPYTGGFMTAAALTLGTPVVTLAGERFSSKFSASILKAANLEDLIAYDKEEYKRRAIEFASKNADELRENVRNRVKESSLLDENSYMKNLEAEYKKIVVGS